MKITSTSLTRLFRLVGPFVAGIVGLIFIVVGATSVASQGWESVTGTASSCQTRIDRAGDPPSHSNHTTCEVAWRTAAGEDHRGTVDFGGSTVSNGQTVDLRVNGDTAVVAMPALWAWGSLIIGLAMAGGGGFRLRWLLRRARAHSGP